MKKILITGSKGFVGDSLTPFLKSKKNEIILSGKSNILNLCDREAVENLPKVDVIIHLAAKSFVPDSFKNPQHFYNNNILSTLNILEKAKKDSAKVIFLSTYVYGNPKHLPIKESHELDPKNPYTQSKIIGEELCQAYSRDFEVPVIIFRPFNIYGPKQKFPWIIPSIISQLSNKEIHLNDSRPKRDYIYIDDVLNAIVKAIDYDSTLLTIFNLGSGISTSTKELVEMLVKLSNSTAKVIFSENQRQGEILDTIADLSKIKEELKWKPSTSIEKGLNMCIKHSYY